MNKNKSKLKSGRKSQKGNWGQVGAPPKKVSWPRGAFILETLFARNSKGNNKQCQLSLRNKVEDGVVAGEILALMPKKQPKGAVGRPKNVFVLKDNYVPSKMELAPSKVKVKKSRTVSVVSVTPAIAVVAPTQDAVPASPAPEAPASPAPVIESVATVETVSTPAVSSSEPAIG
jgi:hypothetical protein